MLPGVTISPGLVVILIFFPSKCSNTKLHSVKASYNEIFFLKYKSAPFLSNFLLFSIVKMTTKSPDYTPGYSSPSP